MILNFRLTLIACLLTISANAQSYRHGDQGKKAQLEDKKQTIDQKKHFITISSGIGSPFGNTGIGYAYAFLPHIISEVGAGLNLFGFIKVGIEANYYLKESKKGFAAGLGFSRTLVSTDINYNFNGYPYHYNIVASNILNINLLYNFILGKKHHFYLRTGYNFSLNKPWHFYYPTTA